MTPAEAVLPSRRRKHRPVPAGLSWELVLRALGDAVRKLDPRLMAANPVMFVVEVVSLLCTGLLLAGAEPGVPTVVVAQIVAWLWFTVLFANFAEALAEGRGRAQAESLRAGRSEVMAKRLTHPGKVECTLVPGSQLRAGDLVLVEAGDTVPGDGEVVAGVAALNEAAITGESAPVIRESGGDRSAVTGGTRVVSDRIWVRITANPGESVMDRMIALVEGARRQKTPNEVALGILLVGLTLVLLLAVATLQPFAVYSETRLPVVYLVALLVTLIPTTIGGLLSAIGIAGMDRLVRHNVIAKSGRAVEAAGDVDTLLLDKTGTITFGNRMADAVLPLPGVTEAELARAALLASLGDETPEGKSIVTLARERYAVSAEDTAITATIPFRAETRLSGADLGEVQLRKGAVDAVLRHVGRDPQSPPADMERMVERIARSGGTPLAVSRNGSLLGVIHLKDIVKPAVKARFAALRLTGIRTVMITGDNRLTAAAIAAESGVDDYLAEATPERKLELIRREQANGRLVAMCGDGANDAPALAQADVGIAMSDGTQAAREAGNMVDLDSDPTKLLEVVRVGKELLITRGALTTFSVANDVAKYFAVIPALFSGALPGLAALNVMGLASPESAILSAVIFNALIIVALIPLALRGVRYRPAPAARLLRQNLLVYGLGGVVAPFVGI
jgi:K+-transporting ATPase ATPase B chain